MSLDLIQLAYLVSAICFIFALKGLSSPKEARIGNFIGIFGMIVALVVTMQLPNFAHKTSILITAIGGGIIGIFIARKIAMTAMPQLVAGFHSFVGLAAILASYSALIAPENFGIVTDEGLKFSALIEMSLGASIGAITFSGSSVAWAKLQGVMKSNSLKFAGQHYFCLVLGIVLVTLTIFFVREQSFLLFNLVVILSLLLGVLLIVPIGGADMPVIVSMLNSYSGWAAAGIGFTIHNSLLIITGALVGSSGAILSYVMCKAMHRSLFNVIFGAFAAVNSNVNNSISKTEKIARISSTEDAAYMLKNSSSVILVPGYGMAVAQSQHAIKEMTNILEAEGVNVRFAIHPVAGRMPGHMNVLLAESNIDYDKVLELEEINHDFAKTDIALVIGANDVTNPAAKNDPDSPIYGMPILDVEHARHVLFIKRSMAAGYAGIENELFYRDNTLMLFGDAKKVIEEIIKFLNEN